MCMVKKRQKLFHITKKGVIVGCAVGLLVGSALLVWAATLPLPSIDNFDDRIVRQTTKLYDRTGETVLYDVYENIKRTTVPLDQISIHVRNATIAIEDENFYHHFGIEPLDFIRAALHNLQVMRFEQGASTITQQVIKNALLTPEKTIARKLKEWILAIRLEQVKTKDEILEIYLNEAPYGGSLYGVESAAQAYFGVSAEELTLAQAAYLAALPKAPTFYSPYGSNRDALEIRQQSVLSAMRENDFITDEEFEAAQNEVVEFKPNAGANILAPHFVMYVREYLAENYDEELIEKGGLKVVTTLDIDMQTKAEEVVEKYALRNAEQFNAENSGLVVIDPKTGQILSMVGSRNYFDPAIDGNFNITTARRQPGSAFKPFAYANAFQKGYTPETIIFDLKTQFSTACAPSNLSHESPCYSPSNYTGTFAGPVSMRDALARSLNIPAIKTLYLAGLNDTFTFAKQMGLSELTDPAQYGLTLVLGGGEVTLLNLTSAYGVFANEGVRNPHTPILEITDANGETIDEFEAREERIVDTQTARRISDVLSDNQARTPIFGPSSNLYIPGYDVAAKTGTTNDFRDAWTMGYTRNFAVGTWSGNNNNTPMAPRAATTVTGPLWNEFMRWLIANYEPGTFIEPESEVNDLNLKPILRGRWGGGISTQIDTVTGNRATRNTPPEARGEMLSGGIHSILHWVDSDNPRGANPSNPARDPQYVRWEYPVQQWLRTTGITPVETVVVPTNTDNDVHSPENKPDVSFSTPRSGDVFRKDERITLRIQNDNDVFDLDEAVYYFNTVQLATVTREPFTFSFTPDDLDIPVYNTNTITVIAKDAVFNSDSATTTIIISNP